jgi:hypothetical protein
MQTMLAQENRTKIAVAFILGWLIPGAGHIYLKKTARGLIFFLCILSMFAIGLFLQGSLVGLDFVDIFGFLKWFAEAGAGLAYLAAKGLGWGAGEITSYTYDYGNIFLYCAGLLNMLIMLDTFDICMGRKN